MADVQTSLLEYLRDSRLVFLQPAVPSVMFFCAVSIGFNSFG